MTRFIPSLALFCTLAASRPIWAQVSVNPGALDQLQPAPESSAPPAKPAIKAAPHRTTRSAQSKPSIASKSKPQPISAKPAPATPAIVTLAPAPPPPVTLPPPIVSQRVTPVPPPIPIVQDAPGVATELPNGTRITFGPGSSDLNPATADAITRVANSGSHAQNVDISLYAYAAGPIDDPSTPRRLSLARALAVRALLISQGMVSTRIYPRVMPPTPPGESKDGLPTDRVDVILSGGTAGAGAALPAATTPK